MNGDILTKGTMLVVAARAVYRFYRMIEVRRLLRLTRKTVIVNSPATHLYLQDINSKEGKDSPNYRSVPDASDFKIMELQPISVKDSIWNIAISLRR